MLKKVLFTVIICIVALGALCGCGDSPQGTFYSLEQAYDSGFITKDDLEQIAYYNNNKTYPEVLDGKIEAAIKETKAYNWRNDGEHSVAEAKAEDFKILRYYGEYNGCYAVAIDDGPYAGVPTDVVNEWVDVRGVQFHNTSHYGIQIWKIAEA